MKYLKVIANLISALFFGSSSVYLFLYSQEIFYAVVSLIFSLFFFLLAYFMPKIDGAVNQMERNKNLRNYYMSLVPGSWPHVKIKLYKNILRHHGIYFFPGPVERMEDRAKELLSKDPQKEWLTNLIERIENMSPFAAQDELKDYP